MRLFMGRVYAVPTNRIEHLRDRSLHVPGQPGIRARVAAGCGDREALEVVIPAVRVRLRGLRARQVAVGEAEHRAGAVGEEVDLDRARTRRNRVVAFPAKGVDEPARRVELDELAARRVPGDALAAVLTAGAGV